MAVPMLSLYSVPLQTSRKLETRRSERVALQGGRVHVCWGPGRGTMSRSENPCQCRSKSESGYMYHSMKKRRTSNFGPSGFIFIAARYVAV